MLLLNSVKVLLFKLKPHSSILRIQQAFNCRNFHFIISRRKSVLNFRKLHSFIPFATRCISSGNRTHDENIKKLNYWKRIAFVFALGITIIIIWIVKRRKTKELHLKLEHCTRIPIDDNLFKSRVSLYRYNGFAFPSEIIMSGVLQELQSFKFNDSDIIVASFPKSGTTWVQEIVYMLTHNLERTDDSSEVLETRFPYLEYPYPGIKSIARLKGQRLIKTHLPATFLPDSFKSSEAKLIYITRNPRDTIVSYWHFMKLLSTVSFIGSFREFLKLFLSDKVPYGPFYEHLKTYTELENIHNVLIITYEDLKKNPVEVIKMISEYLQIPVSDAEAFNVALATTFRSMSENKSVNYEHWKELGFANKDEGKFLRKGEVGDWKNYFTTDMLKDFELWRRKNDPDEIYKFRYSLLNE